MDVGCILSNSLVLGFSSSQRDNQSTWSSGQKELEGMPGGKNLLEQEVKESNQLRKDKTEEKFLQG